MISFGSGLARKVGIRKKGINVRLYLLQEIDQASS